LSWRSVSCHVITSFHDLEPALHLHSLEKAALHAKMILRKWPRNADPVQESGGFGLKFVVLSGILPGFFALEHGARLDLNESRQVF
jgi:hypothetical protein